MSSSRRAGSRVYVGRLPYRCHERDLEKFFKHYGYIREILLKNGYGFVEFEDYRDAEDAVYDLNGRELLGEKVVLELARGAGRRDTFDRRKQPVWFDKYGPPTRTNYRLIVENLSSRVSWQDLKDYMRQAGEVTYADAHKEHRNEGVVEFTSRDDMKTALDKLDDTEINGRRIKLREDKPRGGSSRGRGRRSRSHSRSRSRSRSKSRSRSRSKSRSRSPSKKRSRSGSRKERDGSKKRSRSRSSSKSAKSKSRSKSKSKSRSRSKSKSNGKDKSKSKSKSKSRSKSRSKSKSKSKSRSRSRSADSD